MSLPFANCRDCGVTVCLETDELYDGFCGSCAKAVEKEMEERERLALLTDYGWARLDTETSATAERIDPLAPDEDEVGWDSAPDADHESDMDADEQADGGWIRTDEERYDDARDYRRGHSLFDPPDAAEFCAPDDYDFLLRRSVQMAKEHVA